MQENKKSPLKYSASLARGAGDVARADVAGDLIKPKAAMEIGKSVARTGIALTQYFGKIGEEYDAFVDNVTNNGAQLSDENFEALYDELQSGRSNFILGSKKDRTLKMKDLTELAASYDDYKNLVENVAVMADSKDGLLSTFKNSPEGSAYLDAISGKQKLIKNPNPNADNKNELGVLMNDQWVSVNDLKKIAERNTKDTNFASTVEALALKEMENSEATNMKVINYSISKLVSGSKTKSLVHSEIIPGRTFYEDVVSKIYNNKFEDLGITTEQLFENANILDGIDINEAQNIANSMINDQNYSAQLQEELIDYYSNYIAQQNPTLNQENANDEEDEFL